MMKMMIKVVAAERRSNSILFFKVIFFSKPKSISNLALESK